MQGDSKKYIYTRVYISSTSVAWQYVLKQSGKI